jgi:hypothetical protein
MMSNCVKLLQKKYISKKGNQKSNGFFFKIFRLRRAAGRFAAGVGRLAADLAVTL